MPTRPRPARAAAIAVAVAGLVASGCASAHASSVGQSAPTPGSTVAPPVGTAPATAPSTTTSTAPPTTTAAPTTTTTTTAPPTTTTALPGPLPASLPGFPTGPVTPVGPVGGLAPVVSRVKTDDPVVFLTLDDGVTRDPRIPQFLAEHHIPVTLFLNESYVRSDPAYFAQFLAMGDQVESHTRTHPHLMGSSLADQEGQICGMVHVLDDKLGQHGHLFRPPYGEYDDTTKRAAADCGATAVITWRATLNDGMQIQSGDRLHPGDIVLGHFRPNLYDDLVNLVQKTQEWGLSFGVLEAYLPPPG